MAFHALKLDSNGKTRHFKKDYIGKTIFILCKLFSVIEKIKVIKKQSNSN